MKKSDFVLKLLIPFLFLLLTTGCGKVVCSYCGESRFCEEYDINGTTRYICKDCLRDPNIGIYGNVVRDYSELYENGTLEYPENSPMLAQYSRETGVVYPEGEEPEEEVSTEAEINRILSEETPHVEAPVYIPPSPTPADTAITEEDLVPVTESDYTVNTLQPTEAAQPTPTGTSSAALSGEALVSALNNSLANSGYSLQSSGKDGEYIVAKEGNDLKVRLKISPSAAGDATAVEMLPEGSPSDYVKTVIRSILSYIGSDDYDGLGHDIYNNTIQQGSYSSSGINFTSKVHTPDEIERGAAASSFTIVP